MVDPTAPAGPDFVRGALEMLILRSLVEQSRHGSGILHHLAEIFEALPGVMPRSIYGRLHRMERKGWIASEYRISKSNRLARYYHLTPAGWKRLETSAEAWGTVSALVSGSLLTS